MDDFSGKKMLLNTDGTENASENQASPAGFFKESIGLHQVQLMMQLVDPHDIYSAMHASGSRPAIAGNQPAGLAVILETIV